MTIEEWNSLQPGDWICLTGSEIRYQVLSLGEMEDWSNEAAGEEECWSRQLMLGNCKDPYHPEDPEWVGEYDPGECEYYSKVS